MNYQMYQAYADLTDPLRLAAKTAAPFLSGSWAGLCDNYWVRNVAAACEVLGQTRLTNSRPPFNIDSVKSGGKTVAVTEEIFHVTPFCTLLRFKKDIEADHPRVLLVAPMSGHFATLLRATALTLLRDHDVYITDWHNARDVPLEDGRFGLDEYIEHVATFLEVLGPDSHVVAVCQPTVAVLAAVAMMAQTRNPAQPRTMTLMAGPIDTRINPTEVNRLAMGRPIDWFENNLIGVVPLRYKGALRQVYPGFMQITAFVSMNPARHIQSFHDMYSLLVDGDEKKADSIKTFYEEYFAMSDLPAEFYLETVQKVFQEFDLPQGKLTYHGELIQPQAIRRTALLTVEGERDDICSIGQTLAAQDLCSSILPFRRKHHVQTGVGHYGVFSGRRWDNEVYPIVRDFIYSMA